MQNIGRVRVRVKIFTCGFSWVQRNVLSYRWSFSIRRAERITEQASRVAPAAKEQLEVDKGASSFESRQFYDRDLIFGS